MRRRELFDADLLNLRQCGTGVAYLGEPSLGAGAETAIAMQEDIRILALSESCKPVSRFLLGLLETYENAEVFEYDSLAGASSWIRNKLLRYEPSPLR